MSWRWHRRARFASARADGDPHDLRRVRKFALAWPEVEDGTSYGTPALKVRKKMLARLKEDGDSLVMPGVPQDEREMLVESQPKVFYFTDHYRDYPMVLIRLSKAKRATVEPLLRRHWRTLASKKAVKEFDRIRRVQRVIARRQPEAARVSVRPKDEWHQRSAWSRRRLRASSP